ncbi:ATP-binding protein [Parapusillimonas sp. JC17]|uniref:ATP-binding protein n=1 Tax=Parapusillimonas sp. JC17 TaxID=3445768 RepID=UPI003FA0C8C1
MAVFNVLEAVNRSCDKHGDFTDQRYRFGWTGCQACMAERREAEDRERIAQQQADWERARLQNLFRRSAIPPRFEDRSLENYSADLPGQAKALAIAKQYAATFDESEGVSLIFCGGVGSGKTHLSIGIAKELMRGNRSALFMSVMGAVRSVKETWRNSDVSEREALQNLIDPDLLILDEVGVQFGSDTEKLILFEIINGRYENRRSTIVISNLAIDALTQYLGERVVDRLREGGGKLVVFDWPSFRRRAA